MNAPSQGLHKPSEGEIRQQRLYEIERVLKFDGHHPDRKQLIREYLDLSYPEVEPDL